jgi:hypothetical protein
MLDALRILVRNIEGAWPALSGTPSLISARAAISRAEGR